MIRRIGLLSVLAGVVVAANVSAAGATVTIGQTAGPLTSCASGYDWVAATTPSGNSYVVPEVGTITSWSTNADGGTGDQLTMKVFRKIGDPATYQVVGHSGPETLTLPGMNTFSANVQVQPGDVLGFHTVTGTHCSIEPITDATVNFYLGDLADGASAPFELDTNYLLNIEATLDPTNTFSLGQITRNKKKGTATIDLTLPNSGDLTGSGNGVNAASARQAVTSKSVGAGQAQLLIKAKGKKKKQLNQKGKVKLNVTITYTPTSGSASTQSVPVKLKKKHGRTSEQEKTPRIAGLL